MYTTQKQLRELTFRLNNYLYLYSRMTSFYTISMGIFENCSSATVLERHTIVFVVRYDVSGQNGFIERNRYPNCLCCKISVQHILPDKSGLEFRRYLSLPENLSHLEIWNIDVLNDVIRHYFFNFQIVMQFQKILLSISFKIKVPNLM